MGMDCIILLTELLLLMLFLSMWIIYLYNWWVIILKTNEININQLKNEDNSDSTHEDTGLWSLLGIRKQCFQRMSDVTIIPKYSLT
jgi:hypothetical protein